MYRYFLLFIGALPLYSMREEVFKDKEILVLPNLHCNIASVNTDGTELIINNKTSNEIIVWSTAKEDVVKVHQYSKKHFLNCAQYSKDFSRYALQMTISPCFPLIIVIDSKSGEKVSECRFQGFPGVATVDHSFSKRIRSVPGSPPYLRNMESEDIIKEYKDFDFKNESVMGISYSHSDTLIALRTTEQLILLNTDLQTQFNIKSNTTSDLKDFSIFPNMKRDPVIAFSKDDNYIIEKFANRVIVYDLKTRKIKSRIENCEGEASFSVDTDTVVLLSKNALTFIDIATDNRFSIEIPGEVNYAHSNYSANNKYLACITTKGLYVYDLEHKKLIAQIEEEDLRSPEFSGDEKFFFFADDKFVRRINLAK